MFQPSKGHPQGVRLVHFNSMINKTCTRCKILGVKTYSQKVPIIICGPCSSVDIATDYGLDGPGSNPGGDEIFPPVQTGPGAHPASCKMGTVSFPGVKCGLGVLLTTHPLLVPRPSSAAVMEE